MSTGGASAPAPAEERSKWRGEGVDADELADRLLRMNREHARHEHGHAATRTLNLLVAPGGDVAPDALGTRLAGLSARHPSRTIVVREHAPRRLDATLAIECAVGSRPSGAGYCHDSVELVADAERLRHADSLVRPLRVAGLPTVLWLPGAQPSPAEEPLAAIAATIVLDTRDAAGPAARGMLARAAGLGAERVRDIAWMRLARWRRHLAARFDDPAALALLPRIERLELCCDGPEQASALLLAGWIVARAGWALERLAPGDTAGAWCGSARRADGGDVEIAIDPPKGERCGIHALALRASDAVIAIGAPVAAPDATRAFVAALGLFDAATPGYAAALMTLVEGFTTR